MARRRSSKLLTSMGWSFTRPGTAPPPGDNENMLHLRCARILVLLSTAACAWALAQAQDPLPQAVTEAMRRIGLPAEALAAVALPLLHRDRAWAFQARRPMQPGSSMYVLTSVVALAGYVNDGRGRPWVVAMMVNHDTLADQARPVLDALVDHIARSGPHPQPQPPGPQGDGP